MKRWPMLWFLLLPVIVWGHTSGKVDCVCPLDGTKFKYELDFSGTSFGKRLDFKALGPTAAPWRIAQCPKCKFVLYDEEFEDDEKVQLRMIVKSKEYGKAAKEDSAYYCLAEIKRQMKESRFEVGWILVEASWQVERNQSRYAKFAVEAVNEFTEFAKNADFARFTSMELERVPEEWLALYLSVELQRRLGNFDAAEKTMPPTVSLKGEKVAWFNAAFNYQRKLVSNKDSGEHDMGDWDK